MCLITRKPMRIKDDEINLPILRFKDFDTQPLTTHIHLLRGSPFISESVVKVMLADMFMSKLAILLTGGRIVGHSYNLQRFNSSTSDWAMFYIPKRKRDIDEDCLGRLSRDLTDWSNSLNTYCRMGYFDDDKSVGAVLRVHRAALKLLHLMAEEALIRPLTFPAGLQQRPGPESYGMEEDSSTVQARASVNRIASEISEIFRELREENLSGYLPPLSVGCILTALVSFLVALRLAKKSPTEVPDHEYHECIRSLLTLREVWPVTRGTCAMVNQMATNNQIWFARNLRMLSKPVPVASIEVSLEEPTNFHGSESAHLHEQRHSQTSHKGCTITEGTSDDQLAPVLPPLSQTSGLNDERTVFRNSSVSTYLASMYPFPWTATDFDVFGTETCRELLLDQALDEYDAGAGLDNSMSGYPWSTGQYVEDVTNIPTSNLHEAWR